MTQQPVFNPPSPLSKPRDPSVPPPLHYPSLDYNRGHGPGAGAKRTTPTPASVVKIERLGGTRFF